MGSTTASVVAMSPGQRAYFERLEHEARRVLEVARIARKAGLDPSLDVEIPLAPDLAARVEEQVGIAGIAGRIRELAGEQPSRELLALQCAREVAAGRFRPWPTREAALDKAVRAGLSILTEGILVAPLEGIAKVEIGRNADGSDYVDLFFAGPIRAAGGTAQGMSVLIADVVRRDLGVGSFHVTQAEVERYKEEVPAYKRAQHLQYAPDGDEIEHIVRHCPVSINGEGTEKEEVTGHRDLPRVETNRLRGGAVLVLAEGLTQKAPKIAKIVGALQLPGWDFLERFARKPAGAADSGPGGIEASDLFIKDLIGGRPVFAHPSRPGGFRLRYGRSRTGGLASTSISPVTMRAVDDFLAVGTQMKLERPGKGTICTPCSSAEGPMLLLRNGDLVQPQTLEEFGALHSPVAQIVDLGEILIPFGEFQENNALLPDASFTVEWWMAELGAAAGPAVAHEWRPPREPTWDEALTLSHAHGVPLHPAHNLFWHDLPASEYVALGRALEQAAWGPDSLRVARDPRMKAALVILGVLHLETAEGYVIEHRREALAAGLGLRPNENRLEPVEGRDEALTRTTTDWPVLAAVSHLTGALVRPRAPTRIGARMGRPEKADKRTMDPPVHVLFPVGHAGGVQRSLEEAVSQRTTRVKVGVRRCAACGRVGYLVRCACGARTDPKETPPQEREIPLAEDFRRAQRVLHGAKGPAKVKGVQGLVSASKTPEALEKGILRALHDVWVFKDGTVRFDATDAPLTHFRPAEIGTSVTRLRELGYEVDAQGKPLERPDQLVELRIQDVVLPKSAGDYFVHTAQYVDDLLQRFYGMRPFYMANEPQDLVGHLVAGLAPHTSGAVLGRVIGFTKASAAYAHPFYHAAKRRNCLPGDTQVFVLNSPYPARVSLQELWERTSAVAIRVDAWGTESKETAEVQIPSVNPRTGHIELKRVRRVLRTPAPAHLVEVRTRGGRSLQCTPDHPLVLASRHGILRRAALQSVRRPLGVAGRVPLPTSSQAPLRKQHALEAAAARAKHSRRKPSIGNMVQDPVVSVTPVRNAKPYVFDLEVEDHHTFILANGVASFNCDGDEDAFMLLLDAFLNFSRAFVPDRRGGLMDLPLVLATRIDPSEIDKEALNLDVGWSYPLELYRAAEQHLPARQVASRIDLVGHRLGTPGQFEGFGFTHESASIHEGPVESTYKTLATMPEKMAAQLGLADRLRGVDAADVASRVISHHLLPDLIGNLKAFAKQSVRCTKCNSKYRRTPLAGKCTRLLSNGKDQCGNPLTLTVHPASVRKYLDLCTELSQRYAVPEYTRQHIQLVARFIDDTFRSRDSKLAAFG